MEAGEKKGILLGQGRFYGNTIRVAPPVMIRDEEMEEARRRIEAAIVLADCS